MSLKDFKLKKKNKKTAVFMIFSLSSILSSRNYNTMSCMDLISFQCSCAVMSHQCIPSVTLCVRLGIYVMCMALKK